MVTTIAWYLLFPPVVLPASAGSIANFARGAYYGLFCVACAAVIDSDAPWSADLVSWTGHRPPRFLLISGCLASLLIGINLSGIVVPLIPANRSILVHNRGGLDWDRPVWGKFGPFSGGMFGLFPVYAHANGYRIEILDRDTLRPEDLMGFQTLMLINSPKKWEGRELQTVHDFVANGGSLLVLGDHTDVFGLMTGFNTLLDGFGFQFQFDAAYHARPTWRGCCSTAPDAISSEWDLNESGVAIGASLKLQGSSRVLLNGRYAHSDHGVRENTVGAFLGNYAYENGEELGDTILLATTTFGRGRVIVFGDTSPYQGASSYSFPVTIGPIFQLLSRPTNVFDRPELRTIVAALLLTLVLIWRISRADMASTAAITVMLFVGVGGDGWKVEFNCGLPFRSTPTAF